MSFNTSLGQFESVECHQGSSDVTNWDHVFSNSSTYFIFHALIFISFSKLEEGTDRLNLCNYIPIKVVKYLKFEKIRHFDTL